MKKVIMKSKAFLILFASAGAVSASASVIAGWDTWEDALNPAPNVIASNVTASVVTTSEQLAWGNTDVRGASTDGDWGTHAGPPLADTDAVDLTNLTLFNATTGGTISFTITNDGSADLVLESFNFDAFAFRPKAPRTFQLSVIAGGGITEGIVFTSASLQISHFGGDLVLATHDDIDIPLTTLSDHTLAPGESVELLLAFSEGVGDGSGGHHLFIDNVAVIGTGGTTEPDTWAGFVIDGDTVDTGDWLGLLGVSQAPWVYSYTLSTWIYLPEDLVSDPGAWGYFWK